MGKLKATVAAQATTAAIEDELLRQATAAAIAGARKIIGTGGSIPAGTPVGRLNDTELGWIVMGGIFSWIGKRAEQASAGGFDLIRTEEAIRNTGQVPAPWDAGAVAQILPNVAEIPDMPWDAPIGAWPKDTIVRFLCAAFDLIQHSIKCRDAGDTITRPTPVLADVPFC